MNGDIPARPPEAWLAALGRTEADLAAERTHDFEQVMSQFEAEDA